MGCTYNCPLALPLPPLAQSRGQASGCSNMSCQPLAWRHGTACSRGQERMRTWALIADGKGRPLLDSLPPHLSGCTSHVNHFCL